MQENYNPVSKIIHWTTALLVFGLLSLGFYMASLDFSEDKLELYALHKSFGLLVLMLAFVRVAWHLLVKKPKSLPSHAKWEKGLAHAAHAFLYFALFAMPLTGWVMSSAGDFTIKFFGLDVPDIVAKDKGLFDFTREAHEIIAIILLGVIGMHMAGAFKHHFIDRDATLARMTTQKLGFGGGAVMVLLAGALFMPPAYFIAREFLPHEEGIETAEVSQENAQISDKVASDEVAIESTLPQWKIIPQNSTITFTASQYGQAFSGSFGGFDGQIFFDPENLAQSVADITVKIDPIDTGSDDRDVQAATADWFDVKTYPVAQFKTTSFEKTESGSYIAHATLSIRDVTLPIALPFSLEFKEQDAHTLAFMKGAVTVNRLDFGVGQGQWQSTQAIANEVKIAVELQAQKQ